MSNPLMEKMLDLPEFEVTDFKQNDNDMGFYVETKKRPTFCHVCGCYMPNLVIYKSRKQTVRDISILGKRTALIINLCAFNKKVGVVLYTLNNIITEMNRQNKRQKDLTDYLQLTKNAFTDWKSGKSKSYMKYLPQIAKYLNVSVDFLLADENKKSPDSPLISELSERDRDAARLYRALISAGYVREGETLTTEQIGTLKAVITLLDSSFGNSEK